MKALKILQFLAVAMAAAFPTVSAPALAQAGPGQETAFDAYLEL
jgi:hypothetical protein